MLSSSLLTLALFCTPSDGAAPRFVRDIHYRTIAGVELYMDAYLPAGEGPHPAVMLIHPGCWTAGDKRDMVAFGVLLAHRGYACFSLNYRLAPEHRYPAQIDDCIYALQSVRAHAAQFAIDPERVGAFGLSAGGHLAALLGTLDERRTWSSNPVLRQSTRVQCAVSFFGPTLLSPRPLFDFDTVPPPDLLGDAPLAAYLAASPYCSAGRDDPPFLFVHGALDRMVDVRHSTRMHERLRAQCVRSELVVVPHSGHGDFLFNDPLGSYWSRTLAFLDSELQPAPLPTTSGD